MLYCNSSHWRCDGDKEKRTKTIAYCPNITTPNIIINVHVQKKASTSINVSDDTKCRVPNFGEGKSIKNNCVGKRSIIPVVAYVFLCAREGAFSLIIYLLYVCFLFPKRPLNLMHVPTYRLFCVCLAQFFGIERRVARRRRWRRRRQKAINKSSKIILIAWIVLHLKQATLFNGNEARACECNLRFATHTHTFYIINIWLCLKLPTYAKICFFVFSARSVSHPVLLKFDRENWKANRGTSNKFVT